MFREAKTDGWAGDLLAYVQAAASVQAQVIAGTRGLSWDSVLLDPASHIDPTAQIAALVAGYRAAGLAEVRVHVPKARVEAWRAAAAGRPPPQAEDAEWRDVVARLAARAGRGRG